MKKVTKAIICAAGQGTRFLPMTKAMPKEMLPIIDKPIIQYVVEGAVAAGITDIIIVGSSTKRAIEDHFDHQPELESALREKGKEELANRMHEVAELANFVYLRQKGTYGNGTPVLNAAHLLDDEPFMVLFADDFFNSVVPQAVQMVEAFEKVQKPVISLIEIEPSRAGSYGVAEISRAIDDTTFKIAGLIEKPSPAETPKYNGKVMGSVSGYILTPEFMPYLQSQEADKSGEIYLSNAINRMAREDQIYGRLVEGRYLDCGSPEKYLEAIVDVALSDPELAGDFRAYLSERLK
jgi:UTP--glucose-1-phosphate uridylyltransferase